MLTTEVKAQPISMVYFTGIGCPHCANIDPILLKDKIKTISYGVFIPTFFIVIGLQTDLSVFSDIGSVLLVVVLVVVSLVTSKYISGYFAARVVGFDEIESSFFAATSLPQLSTTLATAFVAFSLGLIDQTLLTSLVMLSVVTVLLSPILIRRYATKLQARKEE